MYNQGINIVCSCYVTVLLIMIITRAEITSDVFELQVDKTYHNMFLGRSNDNKKKTVANKRNI